jgi:hypothetical protein
MKVFILFLFPFMVFGQKSAITFPVYGEVQAKRISIDEVILHIRKLKTTSTMDYGKAVDFYFRHIASAGKNEWIEKLEEFSLDPDCPSPSREKINQQIERIRTLQVGELAPEINQGKFRLSTYQSTQQYFLILFYSPSCFHCTELLVDLIPYSEKKGLSVIALQIDEDPNFWSFPHFWTSLKAGGTIRKDYGVFSTPSLYLIDSKSKRIRAIPENLNQLKALESLF